MDISLRLMKICEMVDKCDIVADIGTDHGYVPIWLVSNDICKYAIASDINSGPLKKAKLNVEIEGLNDKIQLRLGAGLSTLIENEAQCIIIAGMGGNLIRDILEEHIEILKSCKFMILQPVQNPEVLRKYIYSKGFFILDEELCYDENKYYEIIKISYGSCHETVDSIYYEIGKKLLEKRHPLVKPFLMNKIGKYENILDNIKEDTVLAEKRKKQLKDKIYKMRGILKCF